MSLAKRAKRWARYGWWIALPLTLLIGYWFLPISGQVIILPDTVTSSWPQMHLLDGHIVQITDNTPWPFVLLTVNGRAITSPQWRKNPGGTWTWTWHVYTSEKPTRWAFYHDCHTGCRERGRWSTGTPSLTPTPAAIPTKLGVVFADPARDWHGHSGWDVELTYARLAETPFWGIDDLAWRVTQAADNGLRVLVRVDYAQGQSIPPTGDQLALTEYLAYLRRLARDERLRPVYGYLLGSGFNALDANALALARPVTPEWYARLFNGYGEPPDHTDNAIQTMHTENAQVRVLVGPVRPWNVDQGGARRWTIDAPWLNYMHTLVAALDESARAKSALGIPSAAPDGFALHAPGRPELAGDNAAQEPLLDLHTPEWGAAQAGFRVYRDWLDIINAYPTTAGRPVYLTSVNTYTAAENVPPVQNYPTGWLSAALQAVNQEPQIEALCWFVDLERSGADTWDWFSLSKRPGRLIYAAEEFDALLQTRP